MRSCFFLLSLAIVMSVAKPPPIPPDPGVAAVVPPDRVATLRKSVPPPTNPYDDAVPPDTSDDLQAAVVPPDRVKVLAMPPDDNAAQPSPDAVQPSPEAEKQGTSAVVPPDRVQALGSVVPPDRVAPLRKSFPPNPYDDDAVPPDTSYDSNPLHTSGMPRFPPSMPRELAAIPPVDPPYQVTSAVVPPDRVRALGTKEEARPPVPDPNPKVNAVPPVDPWTMTAREAMPPTDSQTRRANAAAVPPGVPPDFDARAMPPPPVDDLMPRFPPTRPIESSIPPIIPPIEGVRPPPGPWVMGGGVLQGGIRSKSVPPPDVDAVPPTDPPAQNRRANAAAFPPGVPPDFGVRAMPPPPVDPWTMTAREAMPPTDSQTRRANAAAVPPGVPPDFGAVPPVDPWTMTAREAIPPIAAQNRRGKAAAIPPGVPPTDPDAMPPPDFDTTGSAMKTSGMPRFPPSLPHDVAHARHAKAQAAADIAAVPVGVASSSRLQLVAFSAGALVAVVALVAVIIALNSTKRSITNLDQIPSFHAQDPIELV